MAKTKKNNLLIAVPAYNEEKNVAILIEQIKQAVPKDDIIIVSDGSIDQTAAIAAKMGVIVIDLPINLGVGNAVQTALIFALNHQYNFLIRLDGDLQHNPKDINKILNQLINRKADVVIGSRFLDPESHTSTAIRLLGIVILRKIISLILRQKITDPTSGFQGYNQEAMLALSSYNSEDYPEIENLITCYKKHLTIREISVTMRKRKYGQSSITKGVAIYFVIKSIFLILINLYRRGNNV